MLNLNAECVSLIFGSFKEILVTFLEKIQYSFKVTLAFEELSNVIYLQPNMNLIEGKSVGALSV